MSADGPVQTPAELKTVIRRQVGGRLFVAVSNREPFVHSHSPDGSVQVRAAVGGLTLALNAVMQAVGGVWVAHGSGDADREAADADGRLRVPPQLPSYTLQRVWLDAAESKDYYNGFANQALWPLCHTAFVKPVFRDAHWRAYRGVNVKFAAEVARAIGEHEAVVFIQDYHLALLPAMIRQRCPRATCLHFWHIPWPVADILRVCPWHGEILAGLLGNHLLGFHTPAFAERFLEAASALPACRREGDGILASGGHRLLVKPFPISIDFDTMAAKAASPECDEAVSRLRERYRLGGKFVILGLERIDYTKGVVERLLAVERLLETEPGMRGRLVHMHAGAPSRSGIPAYRALRDEVKRLEQRINCRYGRDGWKPVVSIRQHLADTEVLALYRLADVCVISSLDDGMNLVAKEFLAARNDEGGRLLLSEFTGAAWELPQAETCNPFATDRFAERLRDASRADRARDAARMRSLRRHVRQRSIYGWVADILSALPSQAAVPS